MRSYIKIYGPPVLKAIKALEKIAVIMPTVCIMNPIVAMMPTEPGSNTLENYFSNLPSDYILDEERCDKIVSKSSEKLGEYDFFFEWFKNPTVNELNDLIQKIDNELSPLGCKYTITTRAR